MANGGGPHGPAKAKKEPSTTSAKKGKPATPRKPVKAEEPKKKPA